MRRCRRAAVAALAMGLAGTAAANADSGLPAGRLVGVDGHQVHLLCVGAGEPTVVMESGLGGSAMDWVRLQPLVGRHARACAYDRAGYGRSEPGPLPRTSARIAQELHSLLHGAGVPGPYVLVGHSFGGYVTMLFARHYPRETAGLVLVDSAHAEQVARFREADIGLNLAPSGDFVLRGNPQVPAGIPSALRPLAESLVSHGSARRTLYAELKSFRASARQASEATAFGKLPLVVVSRGQRVWPYGVRGDRMEALWRELQRDLASRSNNAVHWVAPYSGHYVHLDAPELVADAVKEVLRAARNGGALPARDTIPSLARAWYRVTGGAPWPPSAAAAP